MRFVAAAILISCSCATVQGGNLAEAGGPGLHSIRAEALSARIRFLSDDLLEGRFTGSRGHAIAERYVASELAALGLEPAGEGGSFRQPVPLRSAQRDLSSGTLTLSGQGGDEALKPDEEFILQSDLRTESVDASGPMVFAGYAVVAPEYQYDDLAGLDLKGKIAVVFSGAPLSEREDFFPSVAHAVLGDNRAKIRRLAALGAVGMITVFRPEDENRLPWSRVITGSRLPQMAWLKADGEPGAAPGGVPLRGALHWKAFEKILSRGGIPGGLAALEARARENTLKPFDLNGTLHGTLKTAFTAITSGNVVGILRGSDPKLRDEYVIYTAHLDHLGIGVPIDGDPLYNGALDNASGVASVLEVARAFAAQPERPRRSILFVFVTGEERGLLGSDYYAHNPTVPVSSMVANINIDMLVPQRHLYDVNSLGLDHSTLGGHVRAAAAALRITVSGDPNPKQMSFIRSDQYSFVKLGIPAMYIGPGDKDAAGSTEAGLLLRKKWIATRYHSPKDKWDPAYDYEAMAQVVRADFLTGLSVANAHERPHWNKGDFFGRFPEKDER